MSSEPVNKKKRAAPEAKPPAEGDHRKSVTEDVRLARDTGLCVYEVDDPSQRSDPNDESSRLLKRVAELEGVIRELKNKPHPRWVQPRPDGTSDCGSPKDTCKPSDTITSRSPASTPPFGDGIAESHPRTGTMVQIPRYSSSPLSSPSPTITPASESPPGNILINPTDLELSTRMDLTTLFSPYPGPLPSYEDNCFGTLPNDPLFYDSLVDKAPNSRCSCLSDTETYNALLELSLRLRKAAQVLGQSRCHRIGSQCALNQRIAELDAYTR
ncbi:hypothetical protein VNI00_003960 [Paramarasmius palmivorus]|uniref:Uncharacterized protein n=1 Tax=Paramarasmius palmivorus TaxID=297713 RepID=A0AAW0DPF2_9AGAR